MGDTDELDSFKSFVSFCSFGILEISKRQSRLRVGIQARLTEVAPLSHPVQTICGPTCHDHYWLFRR